MKYFMIEHRSSYQGIENPVVYLPRIGDGAIRFAIQLEAQQALEAYTERFGQDDAFSKSTVVEVEEPQQHMKLRENRTTKEHRAQIRAHAQRQLGDSSNQDLNALCCAQNMLALLDEYDILLEVMEFAGTDGYNRQRRVHDQPKGYITVTVGGVAHKRECVCIECERLRATLAKWGQVYLDL